MVYLTRIERFNAAHRLYNKNWPAEKNFEVFGKCANQNFHGHNYYLHVTVKGKPDPETGFIMNAKELSKLIKSEVTAHLDHSNLNLDVDFLKDIIPSTENVAIAIWKRLESKLEPKLLHCVKLYETETIFVEYYGE